MISWLANTVKKIWMIQFVRFLITGGLNTLFGYGMFALLILINVHYVLAVLVAQICGVLFNFKTYGYIVFKNKNNRLILRFVGVYVITYLITIGLLKVFAIYDVNKLIAGAIILLPVSGISFILNRKFVFKNG